jgi:hypothetical protein
MCNVNLLRERYGNFIDSCYVEGKGYKLTKKSEISSYSLCFAIFGKYLIGDHVFLYNNKDLFNNILRNNILKKKVECQNNILVSKPYLQLLTFTLSALNILGTLSQDPLEEYTLEIINNSPINTLKYSGVFTGKPGSGNLAMFYGILLIHARENLGLNMDSIISLWISLHVDSMNINGFWGSAKSKSYLQFQNGYHQYEILDYLGVEIKFDPTILILKLVDDDGRYAPYPGGGSCYDYDAVHMLTRESSDNHDELLKKTLSSILSSRNSDGGFAESKFIRPLNLNNISKVIKHVAKSNKESLYERVRIAITLFRPKNDKISTHWSTYSREWGESNLWDSWFRILTIARIRIYTGADSITDWGFINYPGIGYNCDLNRIPLIY